MVLSEARKILSGAIDPQQIEGPMEGFTRFVDLLIRRDANGVKRPFF
jgi:hypothetical protein